MSYWEKTRIAIPGDYSFSDECFQENIPVITMIKKFPDSLLKLKWYLPVQCGIVFWQILRDFSINLGQLSSDGQEKCQNGIPNLPSRIDYNSVLIPGKFTCQLLEWRYVGFIAKHVSGITLNSQGNLFVYISKHIILMISWIHRSIRCRTRRKTSGWRYMSMQAYQSTGHPTV